MNTRIVTRRGLTQIEVLVVVSICAVLMGLLLSAVQRVRSTAQRISCASNLRQLALAVHLYDDAHERLPAGCAYPPFDRDPENYFSGISWHTSILPFLEQEALSARAQEAYRLDPQGVASDLHDQNRRTIISGFLCPAESRRMGGIPSLDIAWANTSYLGVMGSSRGERDGVLCPGLAVRFADITDGTSNTIMIGERPPGVDGVFSGWYSLWGHTICHVSQVLPADDAVNFYRGTNCQYPPTPVPLRPGVLDDPCHMFHFWSLHPGGAHFAFADGSVRFLTYEVGDVLVALSTRAGGEIVAEP